MTPKLDSLREALALSPQNIPLLLLFGQTCLDELNFDQARAAFDRVLRHDPANAEAKLGIAAALYLSGNISEAVVRTEALVKEKPSFAEALGFAHPFGTCRRRSNFSEGKLSEGAGAELKPARSHT